ncbi:hypothetical protein PSHT_14376 [Puccinia striiformis]|uniref:Uncharacterized protein n=1 Tax=Puccinia striiformis TaxID=27350 RepID=A0A2S4UKL8_9BASI|nr:hypothetical protein PSHT_14376 [Puccinia striiformis]
MCNWLATDSRTTAALNMNHLPNGGNGSDTVFLIHYLINNLRLPSSKGAQSRIELLLVFYMLEFFEEYYKPIMEGILSSREGRSIAHRNAT